MARFTGFRTGKPMSFLGGDPDSARPANKSPVYMAAAALAYAGYHVEPSTIGGAYAGLWRVSGFPELTEMQLIDLVSQLGLTPPPGARR